MAERRIGVLVANVGTPDAPQTAEVRRYLREFLGDPRVIDINPVGRWLLLNLIILPFRPAKSAEAYRIVWTDRGSPLRFHSQDMVAGLQAELGDRFSVKLGMRYGNPSIPAALKAFGEERVERIVIFPAFPQNAASSTGTALDKIFSELGELWKPIPVTSVPSFYDDRGFIEAFADVARTTTQGAETEHLLFSFHGLPERHMRKGDPTGSHCLTRDDCCAEITDNNRDCYRAQCFATAKLLASALGVDETRWTVGFQSRLGRTPWIQPYTDEIVPKLAASGIKNLTVMCPAFVADCLETLEEIGVRLDADFRAAGGKSLTLVPSLNATPLWVSAAATLIRRSANDGEAVVQPVAETVP
ncbi:MAG: ferrochelatase [Myxococcota bacterium]|jgi:ferrochelatase